MVSVGLRIDHIRARRQVSLVRRAFRVQRVTDRSAFTKTLCEHCGRMLVVGRGTGTDEPEPNKCGALKHQLDPDGVHRYCSRPAGAGTPHRGTRNNQRGSFGVGRCSLHGGNTSSHTKAAERLRRDMMLSELVEELQLDPVHPMESLLERHDAARALVLAIEARIATLQLEPATDNDGKALPAIYGPNHLGDDVPHVLLDLLAEWSDKQARYAKALLDFGVDEARLRLDKAQGARLLEALLSAIERVGLTEDQQRELRHALADEIDPQPD